MYNLFFVIVEQDMFFFVIGCYLASLSLHLILHCEERCIATRSGNGGCPNSTAAKTADQDNKGASLFFSLLTTICGHIGHHI